MSDEVVRWGSLGVARVFENRMVPAIKMTEGCQLAAVASRSLEKAQAAAERHDIPRAYGSYAELLADPEIDVVYIPLPNDLHREWTIRALEAGKHVLCDKPAALTYADAIAMTEAARSAGRRLQEGFMYRHHPQHTRLREIVAAGEIGDLVEVRGVFSYVANRSNRGNIRWNPQQGGGAFLDVGVYPLNAARLYFGVEPVAVFAVEALDSEMSVDMHTTAVLDFGDGRTATITGGFDQGFCSLLEIAGTRGLITADRALNIRDGATTLRIAIEGGAEREEAFPYVNHWAREVADFAACVRDPARPLWPGEDGVRQAAAVEAVRRSAAEMRRVALAEIAET